MEAGTTRRFRAQQINFSWWVNDLHLVIHKRNNQNVPLTACQRSEVLACSSPSRCACSSNFRSCPGTVWGRCPVKTSHSVQRPRGVWNALLGVLSKYSQDTQRPVWGSILCGWCRAGSRCWRVSGSSTVTLRTQEAPRDQSVRIVDWIDVSVCSSTR